MQAYGKGFARVYDARWGGFTDLVAPKIEKLFDSTKAELGLSDSLLDICCGTGNLAHYFLEKGYSVHGIDLSPYMIEHAVRRNQANVDSGRASFDVEDAANFKIQSRFSYVTCLYDAMNHLPSMVAVSSCIQNAFGAIHGKGVFIFDINTKRCLLGWNKSTIQEDDQIYISTKGIYDISMDRAYTQIVGFAREKDGTYERFCETVYNLALSTVEVLASIERAGFTSSYCAAVEDLAVPVEDGESLQRAFFVCKKT